MDPADPPDAHLVAAVARGEPWALECLHARHARAAFAFAWRWLGQREDAEDAVAEAFVEIWKNAARFRNESSARTWILGITRHKVLDLLRRRPDPPATDLDELAENLADEAAGPYEQLARLQDGEMLQACLEALPPAQRESLHLALVEGLRLADIARITGVPENTVATRIHHAKRKLRACVTQRLLAAGAMKNPPRSDDSDT